MRESKVVPHEGRFRIGLWTLEGGIFLEAVACFAPIKPRQSSQSHSQKEGHIHRCGISSISMRKGQLGVSFKKLLDDVHLGKMKGFPAHPPYINLQRLALGDVEAH